MTSAEPTGRSPYPNAAVPTGGLKKKAKTDEVIVKLNGKKLRAGTVPWRLVEGSEGKIEVFLIEGINTPGFWTFPAGSLDPGEEVSLCASRETYEECGAIGPLGRFLGVFEDKNRTYLFSMRVTRVEDEAEEFWHDPHSSYEGSGVRRRRWFTSDTARSVLKKDGPAMLDAFLAVSVHQLLERRRMSPKSHLQVLILGGGDDLFSSIHGHCAGRGEILPASLAIRSSTQAEAQKFAIVAAALWEADALICVGADVSYIVAMAASNSCPTLLLADTPETMAMLLQGDSRVTTHFLRGSSLFALIGFVWHYLIHVVLLESCGVTSLRT